MSAELFDANGGEDELERMSKLIEDLTSKVELFSQQLAPLEAAKNETKAEAERIRLEANEKIAALNARGRQIDEQMFDARKQMKQMQAEAERAKQKIDAMRKAQEAANAFATLEKRWDMLTAGAPWREWAKDHQIEAGRKITYQRRMILADTMGLGKTLSSIIALDMIKAATQDASHEHPFLGEETQVYNYDTSSYDTKIVNGVEQPCGRKVLYFCPSTMIGNVRREVERWAPHRSVVIIGGMTKAERNFALMMMQQHPEYVVICNYEAWRKDKSLVDSLIDISFDTMIIDEAHNIKDRKSSAYKGIARIASESNIPFVVPMTGTPILNKPQELFSLLTLVAPNMFYSENYFLQDYCEQDPYTQRWKFQPGGLDRLAKRISPFFMRRTKEQAGIILPPKTITVHEIEVDEQLYPEQARARNEMRKWGSIMLDPSNAAKGAITAAAMIAVYTRLRQIETWPAGIELKGPDGEIALKLDIQQSQKMDEVIKFDWDDNDWTGLLPEVVADERVVIFSQFTKPLLELKRRCERAGIRAALMIGDTDDKTRNEIREDFDVTITPDRANSKYDVVLCNYRVGGVGLNLTAATQMIILDEEWNPGKRDQAYDRIHRMGQDKPVTIHVLRDKLANGGGIDQWLATIVAQKEETVSEFEKTATEMAEEAFNALKSGLI